ncbi:patatin-like phospholipase family protein [Variovorax sp. HJSM1_2]|uniref:patatin-like phospholipase family protein n=1 Tax=Variovorax sp. HJSM1_2 TaxID=3366263 RepID=UPI003BD0183E
MKRRAAAPAKPVLKSTTKPPTKAIAKAAAQSALESFGEPVTQAAPKAKPTPERQRKEINLALQGGGSHGAFSWGVLDELLRDGRVRIGAISGTSAGAMNAVLVADGMAEGGPERGSECARQKLEGFWADIAQRARFSPLQRSPLDVLRGNWSLDNSPVYTLLSAAQRMWSPTQLNPLQINPLREVLLAHVDFERVHACPLPQLFVAATNVKTGRVKIFDNVNVTADAVMASACLPDLFPAVEIGGESYWDGGYAGNPPLFPLISRTPCSDIVVVQINPIEREGIPHTAAEIHSRINEITFNQSLLKELRAIEFVQRLIEQGAVDPKRYRSLRCHLIENQEALRPLGATSKMNAEWAFLVHLREIGRQTAAAWLTQNFDALGERGTLQIGPMLDE